MSNYKLSNTKNLQVASESTAGLINGILLIFKYQPGADFAAEHDLLYFGTYDSEQMTKEELQKMEDWGWFEQYDSWTYAV